MELSMKELAVTNMSERQRTYRANYRQRLAGWYNGFLHIAIIYTIGLTALYIYISNIRNLSWPEIATVPVIFLFCNFFEWFLHRYVMHRPWKNPILRAVYNRHTLQQSDILPALRARDLYAHGASRRHRPGQPDHAECRLAVHDHDDEHVHALRVHALLHPRPRQLVRAQHAVHQ
jgi:hypothetical protein